MGAAAGFADINVNASATTSSLLPTDPGNEYPHLMDTVATERVVVTCLDDFAAQHGLAEIGYVHSDVQGFEAEVLKGASGLLAQKRIKIILLEVEFDAFYAGQPTFEELYAAMRRYGYHIAAINSMFFDGRAHPRSGNVIFVA